MASRPSFVQGGLVHDGREGVAEGPADDGVGGGHSLIRARSSQKPGYETFTASAPWMATGPRAADRGDGGQHGDAVIAGRVHGAAGGVGAAGNGEAVGLGVDFKPEGGEGAFGGVEAVGFFDA